jgi:hypothetical protein|tara:strand:+ start:900 stop:1238 length:339 start_codon:yes stop_codon:yes gene_type:complete
MSNSNVIRELNYFKSKKYKKINIEGVEVCYDDKKYVRMAPKTSVSISPGSVYLIIKEPKEWVIKYIEIEKEATLVNETGKYMYFTLQNSVFEEEQKELKIHIKSGIFKQWQN